MRRLPGPRIALVLLALLACHASPEETGAEAGGGARAGGSATAAEPVFQEGLARSDDGVEIHYRAGGRGPVALVFVHGWLVDGRIWEPTLRRFAPRFRVVALDLAGHGTSGNERARWSVEAFAGDVAAVVEALGLQRVVLVGHSMAGAITVSAARRLGPRVELLVPVDTLNDADWDLPPEVWEQFFAGLRADFPTQVEAFFRGMLSAPGTPPEVLDAIVAQARAAAPVPAVAMLEAARDYDLRADLRALTLPVHAINTDLNPTKVEANRRYCPGFELELLPGSGHWPQLEQPRAFGDALERVLQAHGYAP